MRKTLTIVLVLALLMAVLAVPASANPTATQVGSTGVYFCFGSPAKPDTFPESGMSLSYNSGTGKYDVVYSNSSYYPSELSLYVYDVDSSSNTVSLVSQSSNIHFEIYDSNGNATTLTTINYNLNNNYNSTSGTYQKSNLFAVKIAGAGDVKVKKGSNDAFTLHFSAPVSNGTSPGQNPKTVNGYLPVGQFATGTGWGSVYANGPQYGSNGSYGDTYKFVGGLNSTGVSLGMLGGYVQFEMSDANLIKNDANNPYGVDFIVYGNAFSGNPEAGMVMVSEDGQTWYNLAGSRHYQSGTTMSTNVSYIKITTDNKTISSGNYSSTFASKGVYYSFDYVPGNYTTAAAANLEIAKATWSGIPTSSGTTVPGVGFWPEYGNSSDFSVAEGYNRVWNDGKVDATATGAPADATGKVYWNRLGEAEVISYCGVTKVPDDALAGLSGANATNYYRFGYADVRANGSSYGTAVNPYATLPASAAGGDGFDLSWAVDASGVPVSVNNVR